MGLLLLAACTVTEAPTAVPWASDPAPITEASLGRTGPSCAPAGPLRVMAVGDSLTLGSPGVDSYRAALSIAARGRLEWVGGLCDGVAAAWDCEHEGRSGLRIDEIRPHALAAVEAYAPDVVLLWAGTNDVVQGYELSSAVGRLLDLRDDLEALGPVVYVATIPPIKPAACAGLCEPARVAFDAELVDAAPPRLVRVDMAVRYPEHYADFAHLTAEGYSLVAGVWWEAMEVSE